MADLKETIKAMCKVYPGGRNAMAGALGMTIAQFNNNLYEKNGCRFFEIHELEAMEDLSGTNLLAEYFSQRRGCLLVDVPKFDDLDQVELYSRSVYTAAMRGQVDQMINEAIEDGVIDEQEAKEISVHHAHHLAARDAEIRCMLALFGRRKGKRS
ncbi:YmfL family putative regulatory protein [Pectobacterium brasiliense]|uniref:YmfL family putative regulatory protein n=1 Tax=Pectobacterium brasiliense TaxID=180957 RepID=UPI0025A2B2AA|nr:YmfL family putative regulatory protein [Pectobacterium brasiliense]WJM83243.1 YmfL family putative regulatory protein [Pectobacterium brasiliense]